MMKKNERIKMLQHTIMITTIIIFVFSLCLEINIAAADETLSVFFGSKLLNKTDWAALNQQNGGGIETKIQSANFNIVMGFFDYQGGNGSNSGSTSEIDVGLGRDTPHGDNSPYFSIGGGISSAGAFLKRGVSSDSDSALGMWASVNLLYEPFRGLSFGLGARYSNANVTLFDEDINAGGMQYGVVFSTRW